MRNTDDYEVQFMNGSYIRAVRVGDAAEANATTFTLTADSGVETGWKEARVMSDYMNVSRIYDEVDRRAIERYEFAQDEINGFVSRRQSRHAPSMTIDENGNIRFNWDMFYSDEPDNEERHKEAQADFEDEKGGFLDDFLNSFNGD